MLQLPQRLRLDLTNTFARHRELLADFSSVWSVFMPMPKRMRSTRRLRRCIPRKRTGGLNLATQPLRVHIETVRPGRRAILKEYAREISGIAQGFDHGAALGDKRRESCSPAVPSLNVAWRRYPPGHLSFVTLIMMEVRDGGFRAAVMRGLAPRIHVF